MTIHLVVRNPARAITPTRVHGDRDSRVRDPKLRESRSGCARVAVRLVRGGGEGGLHGPVGELHLDHLAGGPGADSGLEVGTGGDALVAEPQHDVTLVDPGLLGRAAGGDTA